MTSLLGGATKIAPKFLTLTGHKIAKSQRILKHFARARAMKKKVEGPKYIVTKEAQPWLAPTIQDNF